MARRFGWCLFGIIVLFSAATRLFPQNMGSTETEFDVIAHRAIVPGVPENTISAIQQCIAAGVDMIELDLRIARDGCLVILHDSTVQRTTDGKGSVRSLTLEEIRNLDAGSWCCLGYSNEKVPTFEEALAEMSGSGVGLVLDVKDERFIDPARVMRLILEHGMSSETIIGIRNITSLESWKNSAPDIPILGFIPNQYNLADFIEQGVAIIRLWPDWVDRNPLLIEKVHEGHCEVWVTAEDLPVARCLEFKDLGVDGVLTDRSKELLKALAPTE